MTVVLCAGTFVYQPLLEDFLQTSNRFAAAKLPGRADSNQRLSLALAVLYGTPACKQQALQVVLYFPELFILLAEQSLGNLLMESCKNTNSKSSGQCRGLRFSTLIPRLTVV